MDEPSARKCCFRRTIRCLESLSTALIKLSQWDQATGREGEEGGGGGRERRELLDFKTAVLAGSTKSLLTAFLLSHLAFLVQQPVILHIQYILPINCDFLLSHWSASGLLLGSEISYSANSYCSIISHIRLATSHSWITQHSVISYSSPSCIRILSHLLCQTQHTALLDYSPTCDFLCTVPNHRLPQEYSATCTTR